MNHEFETLYQEYFPRIYAFLYKLTESRDLAEELTQETFYQAFISFHRFRGDSDVFTWLASIAKHTYYRYLRKNKHYLEHIRAEDVISEHTVSEHPEEAIERQLMAEHAKRILLTLPKKYQDVMILRVYAEMSYSQIGSALHISENSARVIYYRAKKMMLEEMKHEYHL